jgi:hypothetical protein
VRGAAETAKKPPQEDVFMLDRLRQGIPPVAEAEFAELAEWFKRNDDRLYRARLGRFTASGCSLGSPTSTLLSHSPPIRQRSRQTTDPSGRHW